MRGVFVFEGFRTTLVIEPPRVPITMRCDRPFIFLIRDDTTGDILFLGRLYDPSFLD
jgi:serine protease inhibitor